MDNNIFENGKKLPLMEDFYTIQGEGFHAGKPAYFIRIGGCDIGCSWCDSKASWNIENNELIDINEIVEKVNKLPVKAVVVTGGEPCKYNLEPLCNLLKVNNIDTYIETSGAYKLTGKWNWICLSPKRNFPPLKELLLIANELKVIIFDELDFKWAEENKKKVSKSCKLFLQPEWSRYEKNILKIVDYVKKNPEWNISLQIHKFMHIP